MSKQVLERIEVILGLINRFQQEVQEVKTLLEQGPESDSSDSEPEEEEKGFELSKEDKNLVKSYFKGPIGTMSKLDIQGLANLANLFDALRSNLTNPKEVGFSADVTKEAEIKDVYTACINNIKSEIERKSSHRGRIY